GQALDWMVTADGGRGWALQLVEQGYRVYVVDRPGQGRPPYVPDLHGPFSAQAPTYEAALRAINPRATATHTQWPGSAQIGDPVVDQFMASQGPALPNAAGAETALRFSGAKLLDETGPAILITHGDGSAFAWLMVDERPALVKALVALEPPAPAAAGGRGGGAPNAPRRLTATPMALDKLKGIPVAVVTAEASAAVDRDPATVAFLREQGATAEQVVLASSGVRGNGPFAMMEKNSRDVLRPVTAWLDARLAGAPAPVQPPVRANSDSTALKLRDHSYFFVGVERKTVPYGTVAFGQSGVQVFTPTEVRHPYPIVLVHGGLGQAVHMMGIGRRPGWVHYFIREGYRVYVMDRPACGRVPNHPDTFGADYLAGYGGGTNLANILRNSVTAPGTPRNTGLVGDELGLQFVANESGLPRRMAEHSEQWAKGAVELLDKIGPAIILTHAYGGCLGWIAADRRPNLIKALVTVESNNNNFEAEVRWGITAVPLTFDPPITSPDQFTLVDWTPPAGSPGPNRPFKIQAEPAHKLRNLAGIPILWMQGENNYSGPAQVQFLKQSGCDTDFIRLRDRGLDGNTNLMLLERNNFEVFGVIKEWLDRRARA
ncbi:MAG: alpha/beta fold hydrolase, partial [Vicinamibacterales bacterium]